MADLILCRRARMQNRLCRRALDEKVTSLQMSKNN